MSKDLCLKSGSERKARAIWVADFIMPSEPRIRSWLSRWGLAPDEQDELLQDAYYALWSLPSVDAIERPAAYFFSVVRNLLTRRRSRLKVVPLDLVSDQEIYSELSLTSPEQQITDRLACEKVLELINALPLRCREAVYLRKVEGWSQKQIAEHLGISERTVEAQVWLGVKAVRNEWNRQEVQCTLAADAMRKGSQGYS